MRFKKYIVFEITQYYPSGGLHDICGSWDTLEEAIQEGAMETVSYGLYKGQRAPKIDCVEIVDRDTWESVDFETPPPPWRMNGEGSTR